ncbi:hypothetical protein [Shewanella aestuarii]|uniref:Uncharacterized protein n=1 Tax=Shewanella aestuarii TaxID=1028752 RepID=A0A6G9QM41_9GAMM|nr:hypothetical protein [Shewanella aestuarii]QIR15117.1 hypothetical protein HBH39_12000 [Shewanella aestuarii]
MLISDVEDALSSIVELMITARRQSLTEPEFEELFNEVVIEKLSQLSYEYPINTAQISKLEKQRWSVYWDIILNKPIFDDMSFSINLCAVDGVLLQASYSEPENKILVIKLR